MKPYYNENGITIFCGDCRDVLPTLSLDKTSIIVTDPPYLTSDSRVPIIGGGVSHRIEDSESVGVPWGYNLDWVNACASLKPQHWIVYANYRMLGGVQMAIEEHAKLSCTFVWRKSNAPQMTRPVPCLDCEFVLWFRHETANCARMGMFNSMVIDVAMPQAGCFADERFLEANSLKAAHPCQKPLAIVLPFVDRLAQPEFRVVDPYAGTGTSLVAAARAGMSAIGIEIEERYCEIAARRLSQNVLSFGGGE